jgi:Protein of unknown function (DUF1194)
MCRGIRPACSGRPCQERILRIAALPRAQMGVLAVFPLYYQRTGIAFAMTQLDRAPYETRRRVIDVSGDGDNNSGRDVTAARDEAIANGITINGLVILTETPPKSPGTIPDELTPTVVVSVT